MSCIGESGSDAENGRLGVLHPLLPISSTVRRQDMPEFWHIDGAIYVNRTSDLNLDTSSNDNPIGFVMP